VRRGAQETTVAAKGPGTFLFGASNELELVSLKRREAAHFQNLLKLRIGIPTARADMDFFQGGVGPTGWFLWFPTFIADGRR
jgi:hypothetical protein